MPLSTVGNEILRRLQDTIYSSRQFHEMHDGHEEATAIRGPVGDHHTSTSAMDPVSGTGHPALDDERHHHITSPSAVSLPMIPTEVSSPSSSPVPPTTISQPSSPNLELMTARSLQDTNPRRRQYSNPSIAAPDINTQTVLRKRILEIQNLSLPEREKARLVQVDIL
jgi:hypothetical protein